MTWLTKKSSKVFLTVCEKLEEDLKVAENEAETLIVNQHMKIKLNKPENITVFP